jgi:hypothetical protein
MGRYSTVPHCGAVLLRGTSHEFCCKPFAGRIRNHLPPPMGRELLDHIVELTKSIPNFPRILNRDLRLVLQHARVSSPNASASNVFISGIPYALDSYRQFITPVSPVFFRTQQRIPIPPGGKEEIIASIGVKESPRPPAVSRRTRFHLLVLSRRTIPDKLS